MTIQFLKYIAAVAEHGSITEAARQIHIFQPSLSAAIKEAENEIGFAIFHRSRSEIALTKEGSPCAVITAGVVRNSSSPLHRRPPGMWNR